MRSASPRATWTTELSKQCRQQQRGAITFARLQPLSEVADQALELKHQRKRTASVDIERVLTARSTAGCGTFTWCESAQEEQKKKAKERTGQKGEDERPRAMETRARLRQPNGVHMPERCAAAEPPNDGLIDTYRVQNSLRDCSFNTEGTSDVRPHTRITPPPPPTPNKEKIIVAAPPIHVFVNYRQLTFISGRGGTYFGIHPKSSPTIQKLFGNPIVNT